eukprot:181039-Hanusia_phi.AAC.1
MPGPGVSMKKTISTCNDGKKPLRGMLRGVAHTMLGDLSLLCWPGDNAERPTAAPAKLYGW